MKKNIKIFFITLFMIFAFGITTSKALTVTKNTTADEMIEALNNGNTLTGISNEMRKANSYIYCRQYGVTIYSGANYTFANTEENKKTTYPGTDENGYAKAYILAADGYDKNSERQEAWWKLLGQKSTTNDLYNIALKYQNYKKSNPSVSITSNDAKLTISDSNALYGPIIVQYSYSGGTVGTHTYQFGGFDYAIYNGTTNVTNKGVVLCTKDGQSITSTEDTSSGYYQVRTSDYNNIELYLKINLTVLTGVKELNLKIQDNTVDYEADVYEIKGTYVATTSYTKYCIACEDKIENAKAPSISLSQGDVVIYSGNYYEYIGKKAETYEDLTIPWHIFNFAGTRVNGVKGYISKETTRYRVYKTDGTYDLLDTLTGAKTSFKNNSIYSYDGVNYKCRFEQCSGITLTSSEIGSHGLSEGHILATYDGQRYVCNFIKFAGCTQSDGSSCAVNVKSGTTYTSQPLFIVDTAVSNVNTDLKLDIDIKLIPVIEFELEKYNSYNDDNKIELTGAKFTIEAMQDGELIYSKTGIQLSDDIEITPKTYSPVYVKITETTPPSGYLVINQSINVKYVISSDKKSWNLTYTPTQEDWSESGFGDSTWGGWTWVDDGSTKFPNVYKSQSEDYIKVSSENGAIKVTVYDEPMIKFTIDKYNSYTADDKKELSGAEFTVEARQDGKVIYSKTGVHADDIIRIAPPTYNPVYVKITETTPPNGYSLLSESINIKYVATGDNKTWDSTYQPSESDWNSSGFEASTWGGWTWENDGNNGFPNVYKSKSGDYIEVALDDNEMLKINIYNEPLIVKGKVWLDGQTGIKPAAAANGNIDSGESGIAGVKVKLYKKDVEEPVAETITDSDGNYIFEAIVIYGQLYDVRFEYDGVNYEATITGGDSKAKENEEDRTNFNNKFTTINYGEAVGTNGEKTKLEYTYNDGTSTLITKNQDNSVQDKFKMIATTKELSKDYMKLTKSANDVNLGLVKRGADIALSTDVYDAKVTINGQTTDYTFNQEDNSVEIGKTQTSENIAYNLNLYTSDYNYRVRDYVNTQDFKEKDYINDENPGIKTGDDLQVYVVYELNIQNQSAGNVKINEVKYIYDEKYTFKGIADSSYGTQDTENIVTINLNGVTLTDGETKTLYLVFEVNEVNDAVEQGDFSNKAEITSYSTDEGLIDVDSQPGNFVNSSEVEDDSDTARGLKITVPTDLTRKITGKVFDNDNSQNVNDVIVQLIELKTVNGKVYEYIWQETVSGTGKGLRLNADGTALEEYTYTQAAGQYEFNGFIPGDYIVRFIYGDGTTYDMTGNVIKYNGQDYKTMADSYYNAEWYNSSSYTAGTSVARDNEARRLETMAYSVEVDASKGVLLKLLNNVTLDTLNETEKEVLISTYKDLYGTEIEEITQDIIEQLLKEQVLKNTWMCAETSKIKVAVDTENITNIATSTIVSGNSETYVEEIPNINLGLELRPVTKIELKKYITGMKLTAANGQTLVNAYVDVNEYLDGTTDVSNKVQGIRDNLVVLGTVWQYEIPQTEINTKVDGAKLEFEYTLVVKNTGDTDYLSTELANAYNNSSTDEYKSTLTNKANEIKGYIRNGTYRTQIGNSLGNSYYVGGTGAETVKTEVTNIRDYVNNDLEFITSGGNVAIDETASRTHRILRDDYSMQEATINTILKTTETTGKMENDGTVVLYTVTLGKNPISSTGKLDFENYIAEVMSYTNAAGRRAMTSTPGNAEIIDHEHRDGKSHEIDEADTGRIQISSATGEDQTTNYIIIIAIAAGIALTAIGVYVIKKYFMK